MGYPFPSIEWLNALSQVLNNDSRYAEIARNWEGDMVVVITPGSMPSPVDLPMTLYLDLWHGTCREVRVIASGEKVPNAAFKLEAKLDQIIMIFQGQLDPMQAMLTRRLKVQGSMAYMMRNIPTVLDFVRCCRLVEIAA
jgi:putative sterol carrier protein